MEPSVLDSPHHEGVVRLPAVAGVAGAVAFLTAGFIVLSSVAGSIIALPLALVPLFAGIGIIRRTVWSAYGYALFAFSEMALLPLVLLRGAGPAAGGARVAEQAITALLVGVLFIYAGRALERTGGAPGSAWPWIAVALVTTLPLMVLQPFSVPTGSMENIILRGDRILVRRLPRRAPARDEVIAFVYPIDRRQTFIKRIAGMPGDRIRISNKILYRNGVQANEPWAIHKSDYLDTYRDNFPSEPDAPIYVPAMNMLAKNVVNGEVVVPPGKYFVLGDNRDQSLDSRYWGFISAADIIGAPVVVYDSIEQPSAVAAEPDLFPWGHRRWDRVFKLF